MRRFLPLLALCFCAKPIDLKKEAERYDAYVNALPDLKSVDKAATIQLKVRYVEAANLPGLSADERSKLFRDLEVKAREVYGYTLAVSEGKPVRITDFFASVDSRFREFPGAYPSHGFLIPFFSENRYARIHEAISSVFRKQPKEKIYGYLGPVRNPDEATDYFLRKLAVIYAEPDLNGKMLLAPANAADERYYSYGHWSSILQTEKATNFFLTNSGIVGADTGMPLYVIARGGVTSALVENNPYSPLQGAGVLAAYPMLADTLFFNAQRGKLTREQKLECILWIWLHELGHLLLKKDEDYTFPDSVHRAPPDLKYYEWVKRVRGSKNHHSAQVPETKKF